MAEETHDGPSSSAADDEQVATFSPGEEQALISESNALKDDANRLYSAGEYNDALDKYQDALAALPLSAQYERAVLHTNMAACHCQLEQWPGAIETATRALDSLVAVEGAKEDGGSSGSTARAQEKKPAREQDGPVMTSQNNPNVQRIRTKALLRRARARSEAGGWHNLAGAESDYQTLSTTPSLVLGPADRRTVQSQLVALPARTKAAQEREMADMWGKLRTLGDGILRPFGLSTDNFQMVKDDKSGGYSMNFNSGGGGAS